MNLSVSVTLVFGCVSFYAALLLFLAWRSHGEDGGSACGQGRSDGA
jgi:hypothetical protein